MSLNCVCAERIINLLTSPPSSFLAELRKVFPAPIDIDLQYDIALAEMLREAVRLALLECASGTAQLPTQFASWKRGAG